MRILVGCKWANTTSQNAQWQMINVGSGTSAAANAVVTLNQDVSDEEVLDQSETIFSCPNPTDGVINIRLKEKDGTAVAKVFTIAGQLVISRQLTETNTKIEVRDLQAGTYFVEVAADSGVKRFKLIKE